MSTYDLLDNCIRIERTAGQIYSIFMQQQEAHPELASLWEKTADEERSHEQQFILAQRLAHSVRTDPTDAPKKSEEIVKKMEEIKARVTSTPLPPAESLRLAIAMEERLAEFHLNQMRIFTDESMNRLFESMMANDRNHVTALKSTLEAMQ